MTLQKDAKNAKEKTINNGKSTKKCRKLDACGTFFFCNFPIKLFEFDA